MASDWLYSGLAQAIRLIQTFRFTDEDIEYLRCEIMIRAGVASFKGVMHNLVLLLYRAGMSLAGR